MEKGLENNGKGSEKYWKRVRKILEKGQKKNLGVGIICTIFALTLPRWKNH